MRQKFPLWATLLTLLGMAVLCALGTWQLHRLAWKTEMIRAVDAEYARDEKSLRLRPRDLDADFTYRRGTLRGRYLYPAEIRLGIKTQDGKPGYHIYTPLLLADGSAVLVNRGWAPLDWKNPLTGRSRRETILGLLQQPPQPNAFTPLNAPEKDVWYRIDLPQIAEAKKIAKLRPYVLVAEHMPQDRDFPRALPAHPALPNNHFSYAIFWFAMAAALAVVYALRFLKGKK